MCVHAALVVVAFLKQDSQLDIYINNGFILLLMEAI